MPPTPRPLPSDDVYLAMLATSPLSQLERDAVRQEQLDTFIELTMTFNVLDSDDDAEPPTAVAHGMDRTTGVSGSGEGRSRLKDAESRLIAWGTQDTQVSLINRL